MFENDVFA